MRIRYAVLFILVALLSACNQESGLGGKSTIKGYLVIEQYNDDYSVFVDSMPAKDEKVFIQYGTTQAVSDDVETSPDGYFEFEYLYEGDYTIFYYSKDSSDQYSDKKEVLVEVQLGKDETKDLGVLKIFEALDFDEGKAFISGTVFEVDKSYPFDTIVITELPVYIRSVNHNLYDDRIRTQEDGSFYFNNLLPGKYYVYVFSEDNSKDQYAIMDSVTITSHEYKEYPLGDVFTYNY